MNETSAAFRTAEVRGSGMRRGAIAERGASASDSDRRPIASATGRTKTGALAVCAPVSSARIAQIAQ